MAPYIPPEIVILIVSNIDQLRDRLPFLRVCRSWNDLLRPTVFSSIYIEDNKCLLSDLVDVVHRDSQIAYAIRAIECRLEVDSYPCFRDAFIDAFNPDILEDSLEYLSQAPCDWPELRRRMISGHEDVWICLLLLKLQGLRTLCLALDRLPHISIMVERLVHPDDGDDTIALQRLESLQIGTKEYCDYKDCHASSLAPFFLLPSMRVFRGFKIHQESQSFTNSLDQWEFGYDCSTFETEKLPEKCSSVREIILEESNCEFGFHEYIAACECLERFEYQHTNEAWHARVYINFRPCAFYEPLRLHSRTLRKLRLNDMGVGRRLPKSEYDLNGKRPRETIETWFGSLLEFTALKEVRMPLETLVGGR